MAKAVDVLVVGGGMAGACAAAALAALGREVHLLDAGVNRHKQLAGELIHPPGVAHLHRFGLGNALAHAGAQDVSGFAVLSASGDSQLLPYSEVPGLTHAGAAVDHADLCAALLDLVASLPRVTLQRPARVTGLQELPDAVQVQLSSSEQLSARLVIAADGRASTLRRMAGISESRTTLSAMEGHLIPAGLLPHPGFGHVFVEGPSLVLAYRISATRARVMLDLPDRTTQVPSLHFLPPAMRDALHLQRTQGGRPLTAANSTVIPEVSAKGRIALVGDAAGCCHPLTASGLASCAHDAAALARAVTASPRDEREALRRYVRLRQGGQRTRISLASALYQALGNATPEMELLRRGLFRYWRDSPEGRASSMGLLSTQDARIGAMAREYARVMAYSLPALMAPGSLRSPLRHRPRTAVNLLRSALPWVSQTLLGAFDELPGAGLLS